MSKKVIGFFALHTNSVLLEYKEMGYTCNKAKMTAHNEAEIVYIFDSCDNMLESKVRGIEFDSVINPPYLWITRRVKVRETK